ncbi:hypothetical protein RCO28_31055 [Streptomyces sp. LHD-70]|uniref:hypothetical protein n=1 Tax=Streptomyces sp. LHD-70 TaxID=3072140 RepID=UPI00280F019F|nr:hypothetical protein [Streptomyces sp. LHD-70]MDQ8706877.1 hypothetical protein [Streptomyces sp. LHD-70]
MRELEIRSGARLVVVGAIGESASSEAAFLVSMRLNCRGVRTVNLGTGITLSEAATALARHHGAEALLLVSESGVHVTRQLSGLAALRTAGDVAGPVFVGGAGTGSWRKLRPLAAELRGLGVTEVLSDLADAAALLPSQVAAALPPVAGARALPESVAARVA